MVDRVAVSLALLGPQILMLPVVIFDRDADARGGISKLQERDVVPASAEAVRAPDLSDIEPDLQPVGEAVEIARYVARRAVILAAEAVDRLGQVGLTLRPRPL